MDKVKFYIAPILQELVENYFSDICDKVYAGHRPSGIEGMDEFLVIRTSSAIGEHNVYQQSSCFFEINVKNIEHGLENTLRLQEIVDDIAEKLPMISDDKRFTIGEPRLIIKGDDGLQFTQWLLRSSLQINTTDRFSF